MRTEDEARMIAEKEMTALMANELKNAEILEMTVSSALVDNEYIIPRDIMCLEDIALEVNIN
jgi:hypothetical protein